MARTDFPAVSILTISLTGSTGVRVQLDGVVLQ